MCPNPIIYCVIPLLLISACGSGGGGDSPATPVTVSGLDGRPTNIGMERAYPNLSFRYPVALLQEPANSDRWYVVEKGGQIIWINAGDETTGSKNTYLDFSSVVDDRGEGGLLSMTFHPDFINNALVYLSYTVAADDDPNNTMVSRITRLTENASGNFLDSASEVVVLEQNQFATNHNGGHLAFGPDGFLYIGLGDGGGGGDPQEQGQDTSTLLGSLLRLDVDSGTPFSIPADNPFASGSGRPEIYAYGLRNPWRWSFDRATGDLWLGDVGQSDFEEIDRIVKGGNYGWDCFEASAAFEPAGCPPASQFIFPVAEYGRSEGVSVTGGYVYRGTAIPALKGVYIFGDFGSGTIWGLFPQTGGGFDRQVLVDSDLAVVSFAQANDGELLVVDFGGGLYRLVLESAGDQTDGPAI